MKKNINLMLLLILSLVIIMIIVKVKTVITAKEDSTTNRPITEESTLLKKYLLGVDLVGRDFSEIIDIDTKVFKNDPKTISDASISIKFINSRTENYQTYNIVYIKYNNDTYKLKLLTNVYIDEKGYQVQHFTTDGEYGVVKIDLKGERVGKTVKYDNKIWTILYDDSINGLQMISNQSFLYNNEKFYLGYEESLINDWGKITNAEFDGIAGLSNFEKAVYSYNNAIDELNVACKNIVVANENIIDVRCVGSNPTNKNLENKTLYISEHLIKCPINNSKYAAGIGNKIGKSTDLNYISDFDRMVALGVEKAYDATGKGVDYWLASRFVKEDADETNFNIRYVWGSGEYGQTFLWGVKEDYAFELNEERGIRPVVILSPNIQMVVDTTGEADYTF